MNGHARRSPWAIAVAAAVGAVLLVVAYNTAMRAAAQVAGVPVFGQRTSENSGRQIFGVLQNGRYHHNTTGIEFAVPPDWALVGAGPSSDGGDGVTLRDSVTGGVLSVWMINRAASLEDSRAASVDDEYRNLIGMKIRMRFDQGLKDYWVPADTIQERYVNGRKALTAIGESAQRGRSIRERLAWIYTPKTRAFFYGTVPAEDMPQFQYRFDSILDTATLN
jgi:hypothetical protein